MAVFEAQVTRAARRLSGLRVPNRARGVVGVYDVADDWTPIYDRTELAGFYVAIGASGNQFKNAPVVGRLMAALVDQVEAGADHDREPVRYRGPHTGLDIDPGSFSRSGRATPAAPARCWADPRAVYLGRAGGDRSGGDDMADGGLQSIVEEFAERLRRSVAIDDPSIRLLAASRHFGDEDQVRVGSVLNRAVDPELADRVLSLGIAGWAAPGVTTVEGALPRLCVPVRCNGMLLGYLWLIDEFADRETTAAAEAAATAGTVLYRRLLLHERWKARQEGILRELVSSDAAVRAQAVEDLLAEKLVRRRLHAVHRARRVVPGHAHDVGSATGRLRGRDRARHPHDG
ncbi:FAD dependent oxidoreductase [Saccharopolyspora spinosa]|uniref:FAD dependent oxidoreductase n=1 Tax=Saccharopolyspora spinosa TaxID=60894 RepID=A0A2N3Y8F7_SACSN|nr:hypothetical protein [Saccharopolyspora spinosa]PKW19188.1 FAD dependent oxidoreductase [Saccharopolyspora spinosa]